MRDALVSHPPCSQLSSTCPQQEWGAEVVFAEPGVFAVALQASRLTDGEEWLSHTPLLVHVAAVES